MVENGAVIVAAAFCPTPPVLHPQVLPSDGHDRVSELRLACAQALGRVLAVEPAAVLVLGGDAASDTTSEGMSAIACGDSDANVYGPGDAGDLSGHGVPVRLGFDGPPSAAAVRLPLAHTLGAWLLDEAGFAGERLGLSTSTRSPLLYSARADDRRWAMLVMGDASACRTEQSPGWYDPDAIPFDDRVLSALAGGEAQALLDLDVTVGCRVMAAGITAWRTAGEILVGTSMEAHVHYADDPFGVFYIVASWVRSGG